MRDRTLSKPLRSWAREAQHCPIYVRFFRQIMLTIRRLAPVAALFAGFTTSVFAQTPAKPTPAPAAGEATEAIDPIEAQKIEADVAYRQQKYAKAIELTTAVLQKKAEDHVALYLRASARVEQGVQTRNAQLIRDGIKDAREAIGFEKQGKADYYLPYLYGMTSLAITEANPKHAETGVGIADQLLADTKYNTQERANIYYQRGLANIQARHPEEAQKDFKEAIKRKLDHLAAHVALCNLINETKGRDEALIAYNQAIASVPNSALLLNNRGMHFHAMGRDKEAISDLTSALKKDPQFLPALINRGFINTQAGHAEEAEKDLTAAIEMAPTSTQPYTMRGNARVSQGRAADAIEDYRKVTEMNPASGIAAADLGFALFFTGDFAVALSQFELAIKKDPSIPFLTPWRVAAARRIGKDLANDPAVKKALAAESSMRTWFDWLTLHQLGKVEDVALLAAVNSSDATAQKAQHCEAYYFIGIEMVRKKQLDDAKASFVQAVETEAERLSAYRGARMALSAIDKSN
jgi:tetratricopeptide (TPR) repeat protein